MNQSHFQKMAISKYLHLMIAISLALSSFSQGMTIDQVPELKIDGSYEDWKSVEDLPFPSSQDLWQAQGEFDEDDLKTNLKIGTNDQGIYFLVEWYDDIVDSKSIPKSASTITTTSGARMDKMYFYDNIKIQVRTDSTNYVVWIKPEESALQWSSLRKKTADSWSSISTSDPEYSFRKNDLGVLIELFLSWEQIAISGKAFSLLVIINDSDLTTDDESIRLKAQRSYVSFSQLIELQ